MSVRISKAGNIVDAIRIALWGDKVMFGDVVERYGLFRLHTYAIALKDGRLLNYREYWIVVGDLPVPLFLKIRGYSTIVRGRQGSFRHCISIGEIPIERSTPSGLYTRVDKWLKHKQIEIACYAEQVATASDAGIGNPRQAEFYRNRIAQAEIDSQIVSDAFREFLREYPDAAAATKSSAKSDEREAHRARKRMQRGFRLINRTLLR